MLLYHGTNTFFDKIDLSKSRPNKDFGPGFYASAEYDQALAMSDIKVSQSGGERYVFEYEFDYEGLKNSGLKVLVFDGYSKEWADFIIKNRDKSHKEKVHEYDFVYGPIADDKVGLQVQLYIQDLIGIETLLERIKYHKSTFQYYFGSVESLNFLKNIHHGNRDRI